MEICAAKPLLLTRGISINPISAPFALLIAPMSLVLGLNLGLDLSLDRDIALIFDFPIFRRVE
jgi:hypothetical protein